MAPSETPALSAPNDGLGRPLSQMGIALLIKFMREHPEIELFVTDKKATGETAAADDGKLLIGPESTLQAQIGKNRLGIIFHEERFSLTPESVAKIREITAREAAQVLATEEEPEPRIDLSYRDLHKTETAPLDARRKLESELESVMKRVAPRMNPDNSKLSIECGFPAMEKCMEMARAAGFSLSSYPHPEGGKRTIQGIMGDSIRLLLNGILVKLGYSKHVAKLRETDRHNIGTYALFFDRHNGALVITNKTAAMMI